ncbi:MAG: hypothetical protein ACKVP9_15690 [Burkholderiales bacterium]
MIVVVRGKSAHEQGAKVLILEVACDEESGGNSRYAGGLMRFAYDSVEDLRQLMTITEEEAATTDCREAPSIRRS